MQNPQINNFKIIASFASITNEKRSANNINKHPYNLIDKVVSSIVYYEEEINYQVLEEMCNTLYKINKLQHKKLIVVNVDMYDTLGITKRIDSNTLKVVDINILSFIDILKTKSFHVPEILNKLDELNSSKEYTNSSKQTNFKLNENLLSKFSFLNKLEFLSLFENENHNSIDIDYNLIFIFHNIIWSNIVGLFKINGIELYGGSGTRRHLLSTVQSNLVVFLLLIKKFNYNFNYIYKSFNAIESYDKKLKYEILHNSTEDFLKVNHDEIFNELDTFKDEYGEPLYENRIILLNLSVYYLTQIIQIGTQIEHKINEIKTVNANLAADKSLQHKYSASSSSYNSTNIQNIEKRNIINNTELLKLEKEKEYLIVNFYINLNRLNLVDPNYFDEKGNFTLNPIFSITKKYPYLNLEEYETDKNTTNLKGKNKNTLNNSSNNKKNNNNNNSNIKEFFNCKTSKIDSVNNNQKRSYSTAISKSAIALSIPKNLVIINNSNNNNNTKNTNNYNNYENISNLLDKVTSNKESHSSKFLFLDFLDKIIRDSNLDPINSQITLENKWVEDLIAKLDSFDSKSRKSLSYIIKKANETLTLKKEKKSFKNKFPIFYEKLNKNHLIISYSLLTTFYNKLGFTAIAMKIANDILYDIYSKEWIKNINENNIYIRFNSYILNLGIDQIIKLKLGSFFIEIFCSKPTSLFERSYKEPNCLEEEIKDKDLAILVVNEEFFEFINNNFIISPVSLPMLCPPNKWSDTEYGGFLENNQNKNSIITGSINHSHNIEHKESLYNSINKINSVKFKINTNLLNYLENEGNYLLEHYFKTLKNKTKISQSIITLKIAKSFSNLKNPFYISTNADWRGRIYTQSFFLSYQGGDLSNALLNFFEGMPLTETGKRYLYLYGANCYNVNNLSKNSFDDRLDWVNENYDKIIKLNKDFILKAENLFLFTSFCLILRDLHFNPKTKVHIPVFLDATCSGIQHLSALINDLESGMKVNLIPQTKNEKVGDIYSDFILPVNQALHNYGELNEEYSEFKKIKLTRKHLKLPIMTKVYNVSLIGIANQLRNSFEKIKINKQTTYFLVPSEDGHIKLTYREIYTLAEIINSQIFVSLPSLKFIYDYFKSIVSISIRFSIPITWITPSGLKITQFYKLSNPQKVSISFKNTSISVILRKDVNKLDNKKQIQAIIPNIVHSLDAAHLINIVNTCLKKYNSLSVLTVHDCFGTHPNNLEQLKFIVILEFVKLYTEQNFLQLFHNRVLQSFSDNKIEVFKDDKGKEYIKPKRTKIYFPDLPQPGNLNLEKIMESQYFIT